MSSANPLSIRLREETKDAHTLTERAPLFAAIFRETCPPEAMITLLRGLLPVYTRLEMALDAHQTHELVGAFHLPALYRTEALHADLMQLAPETLSEPAIEEAQAYADHISMLAETSPLLLVAHAYTRYLGDLSGGQMLGKKAKAIVGQDLAFYAFPEIKNPGAAKTDFRKRLDDLKLTTEQADALVAEASLSFELNADLAAGAWPA